jgi:hypothetical protein
MKTFDKLYTESKLMQIIFGAFITSLFNIIVMYFNFIKITEQQQLKSVYFFLFVTVIVSIISMKSYWLGYGLAIHSLITGAFSVSGIMKITTEQQIFFALFYFLVIVISVTNYNKSTETCEQHDTPPQKEGK